MRNEDNVAVVSSLHQALFLTKGKASSMRETRYMRRREKWPKFTKQMDRVQDGGAGLNLMSRHHKIETGVMGERRVDWLELYNQKAVYHPRMAKIQIGVLSSAIPTYSTMLYMYVYVHVWNCIPMYIMCIYMFAIHANVHVHLGILLLYLV